MAKMSPDEIISEFKTQHQRAFPEKTCSDFLWFKHGNRVFFRREPALVTYGADMYYEEDMTRFISTMKNIADNPDVALHFVYADVVADYAKTILEDLVRFAKPIFSRKGDTVALQKNWVTDYDQASWRAHIASEYFKIAELIRKKKYVEAMDVRSAMDTADRDELPDDVFLFLKDCFEDALKKQQSTKAVKKKNA